jgi:hypothetical protein
MNFIIKLFLIISISSCSNLAERKKNKKVYNKLNQVFAHKDTAMFDPKKDNSQNFEFNEGNDELIFKKKKLRFHLATFQLETETMLKIEAASYSSFFADSLKDVIKGLLYIKEMKTGKLVKLSKSQIKPGYDMGGTHIKIDYTSSKLMPGAYKIAIFANTLKNETYNTKAKSYVGASEVSSNHDLRTSNKGVLSLKVKNK